MTASSGMTASELDDVYTALAQAIGRTPAPQIERLLATLCLDLLSQHARSDQAMASIARAQSLLDAAEQNPSNIP